MDIEILHEERLRYWCGRLKMPGEAVDALARVLRAILVDPELLHHFTGLHESYVVRGEWPKIWGVHPVDPLVERALGQDASLFYLLVYLSGLPFAERRYQALCIEPEILDATHYDITFYLLQASDVHGHWVFDQFGWIWRHLACELFRLGRLQFALIPFNSGVKAFRNRQTGEFRLLCDPELPLRADGFAEGAGGKPSGSETWNPIYEESEAGWRGNPVAPRGFGLREPVLLARDAWELYLSRGDTVLDLHIPRGKTLTADECRDSFRRGFDFFARPELVRDGLGRPFKAAYCHTWFFTPQLQTLLPPESSIVHFQREFYLYPHAGGPNFLWTFVFGEKYKDRAGAPRDTSLRRAVLDWLEAGNELFDLPGLMFHRPEEWGKQPYMTQWGM